MKTDNIDSIEFDGVDFNDYPDFCDAFICYAERNGEPMTSTELNELNEDTGFVYEKLMDSLL